MVATNISKPLLYQMPFAAISCACPNLVLPNQVIHLHLLPSPSLVLQVKSLSRTFRDVCQLVYFFACTHILRASRPRISCAARAYTWYLGDFHSCISPVGRGSSFGFRLQSNADANPRCDREDIGSDKVLVCHAESVGSSHTYNNVHILSKMIVGTKMCLTPS